MDTIFSYRPNRKKIATWLLIFLLFFPVTCFIAMKVLWWGTPAKPVVVTLIDKSVSTADGRGHSSFFWVLKNQKYIKPDRSGYEASLDYFGAFPTGDGTYRGNDLNAFDEEKLDSVCAVSDIIYFADTYGVYGAPRKGAESGLIYGGLDNNDLVFLKKAKERKKVIIAEFNILQAPTKRSIRKGFEDEFGIEWTGWTGKYYRSLDPINGELPAWLVPSYENQHGTNWAFSSAGIVLAHEDGRVEVLAEGIDLDDALPLVRTFGYGTDSLNMAKTSGYLQWFDVVRYNDSINHAVSAYELRVSKTGSEQLSRLGIPTRFPAVVMHKGNDYTFFYFCGDFCSKPVSYKTARMSGIQYLSSLLRDQDNRQGGDSFFYRLYMPMVSGIIGHQYKTQAKP